MIKSITKLLFVASIVISSTIACGEDDITTAITGRWSIDSITYNNRDIRACLSINTVHFEENFCSVPNLISAECGIDDLTNNKDGSWILLNKKSQLEIEINNHIFQGKYQMKFIDDTIRKMLVLELKSESTTMYCRKGLFSYDNNRKLIKKITGGASK